MRTVTFQSVYEAVVRRHGLDPLGDAINYDTARAIAERITERVQTGWTYWPFPELSVTEERAYRTVWNATHQFYRGDEVFFIPNATYYKTKPDVDPPVGAPPAVVEGGAGDGEWIDQQSYWTRLDTVDTYVAYDQTCKKPMGQVLGVYSRNPRMNMQGGCCCREICLNFRPSSKGIDVYYPQGPTVFVQFMLTEPEFTMVPWIAGKGYSSGSLVFNTDDGNCYRSLTNTNTTPPTDVNHWMLMPFPAVLALYVKAGAYADCLRETIFNGVDEPTRMARATAAIAEAESHIQAEIDALIAQGQLFYYTTKRPYPPAIVVTQPWTGATVSELTDVCEPGFEGYPPPPVTPLVTWEYRPEIISLRGPAEPSLSGFETVLWQVGSKMEIVIGNQEQVYQLRAGAADSADPGHVTPADYNLVSNNKHWERVG